MTLEQKFWNNIEFIPFHSCWEWIGGRDGRRYGLISHNKKLIKSHRLSYEIHKGKIPQYTSYHGLCVMHKCDNRGCVNPDHLELGTHLDNIRDMYRKKRNINKGLSGIKNPMSKLNVKIANEIRNKYSEIKSQPKIAKMYNVSQTTVSEIIRNLRWVS